MAWEYRIHRFDRKGAIHRDQSVAQRVLDDYGSRGWALVSISDSEALAVFKRRAAHTAVETETLKASLAGELKELTTAIEELNR